MRVLWAYPRLPGVLTPGPASAVCATAGNPCHVFNAVKQKFQLYKWPLWMGQERAKLNRKRTLCRISPYSMDPTVWGFNVWFCLTGKTDQNSRSILDFQILEGLVARGGGGPLRTENVKYAVLNSQQGNSGLKHRGTLRKADCLDFRVLNPQPRCVTVYSSRKGKTEAQGQICISIQWSIWIAALSTHNTCFVGEKSPAAECTRNTLRSPPRIWSMWGINQSILISVIQNKQLLYLAGLT